MPKTKCVGSWYRYLYPLLNFRNGKFAIVLKFKIPTRHPLPGREGAYLVVDPLLMPQSAPQPTRAFVDNPVRGPQDSPAGDYRFCRLRGIAPSGTATAPAIPARRTGYALPCARICWLGSWSRGFPRGCLFFSLKSTHSTEACEGAPAARVVSTMASQGKGGKRKDPPGHSLVQKSLADFFFRPENKTTGFGLATGRENSLPMAGGAGTTVAGVPELCPLSELAGKSRHVASRVQDQSSGAQPTSSIDNGISCRVPEPDNAGGPISRSFRRLFLAGGITFIARHVQVCRYVLMVQRLQVKEAAVGKITKATNLILKTNSRKR